MWKFQNFFATQILREIKVGEFKSSEIAISTHLEALNFACYEFLYFVKAKIDQKFKFRGTKIAKMAF